MVVVFSDKQVAKKLMKAAFRKGASRRFVWIGSDAWGGLKTHFETDGEKAVVEGAINVLPKQRALAGFKEYFRFVRTSFKHTFLTLLRYVFVQDHTCKIVIITIIPYIKLYIGDSAERFKFPAYCVTCSIGASVDLCCLASSLCVLASSIQPRTKITPGLLSTGKNSGSVGWSSSPKHPSTTILRPGVTPTNPYRRRNLKDCISSAMLHTPLRMRCTTFTACGR